MLPKMAFTGFASRYREPTLDEGFEDITKVNFKVGCDGVRWGWPENGPRPQLAVACMETAQLTFIDMTVRRDRRAKGPMAQVLGIIIESFTCERVKVGCESCDAEAHVNVRQVRFKTSALLQHLHPVCTSEARRRWRAAHGQAHAATSSTRGKPNGHLASYANLRHGARDFSQDGKPMNRGRQGQAHRPQVRRRATPAEWAEFRKNVRCQSV